MVGAGDYSGKYGLYLSCPNFFKQQIDVRNCSPFDRNVYATNIRNVVDQVFPISTSLMEATKATLYNQIYKVGMFVAHGHCSGVPEYCKIVRLLFHFSSAYFLCQHYRASFDEHFARFELTSTNMYHIIDLKLLSDFSPLHGYIVNGRLYIVPKRFIENASTADFT